MSKANRYYLKALAERTAAEANENTPRDVPNRAEMRLKGLNLTRRMGKPNARLKKARKKHTG